MVKGSLPQEPVVEQSRNAALQRDGLEMGSVAFTAVPVAAGDRLHRRRRLWSCSHGSHSGCQGRDKGGGLYGVQYPSIFVFFKAGGSGSLAG